ncbi:MAG: Uma2 family endonuclease [Bacteroidota bacterium]
MAEVREKQWTYSEYSTLGEGVIFEIIDGEKIMSPAPNRQHQDISSEIFFRLKKFVNEQNLGKVYSAPIDVVLAENQVVQPDVLFVSKERPNLLKPFGIDGAPDLIMEIISPSSVKYDRHVKLKLYEQANVREYWIIDGANTSIEVFFKEGESYELVSFAAETGKVYSNLLKGFEVGIEEIMPKTF